MKFIFKIRTIKIENMKHLTSLLIICLLYICSANAQTTKKTETKKTVKTKLVKAKKFPREGDLETKFNYIVEKSGKYQIYRVIRIDWLKKMKKNIADTAKTNIKNKQILLSQIDKQLVNINSLKTELDITKQQLEESDTNKNSFQLFGINIKKSVMWLINGLFFLSALVFLLLFKRSNTITKETKDSLNHINEEFEAHRKRALEKEQVLARKLHDALHK